ncbi:MAG: hypothetical protein AAFZ89_07685 [Bacteroidota bacterium]
MKINNLPRAKTLIIPVLSLLVPFFSLGQKKEHHNDSDSSQKDPGFELVISETVIVNPEAGHNDPVTEIHFTYWTSHYWAFGLGYSVVFEDEGRIGQEITPLISHKPWPILTINVGPSFALPNSEQDLEVAAYFEGEVNIMIGKNGFHTGPVIGTLIGGEFRYFGGIHIGYEF